MTGADQGREMSRDVVAVGPRQCPTGLSGRRQLTQGGLILGLLLFSGLVFASLVSAAPSHPFIETFGSAAQPSLTTPMGMAVDQSNGATGGDLLVVDAGRNERQRIVITEGSTTLSGSYELTFNGSTTGWTGSGSVTCDGASTSITSVTTSTGAVAKGELITSAPGSCIKPNTTIVSCVPVNCNSPTSLNLSQATENNASSGVVNLSADLNFSITGAGGLLEALAKLPSIGGPTSGATNSTVTEASMTSPVKRLIEFRNALGTLDVSTMSCDASGLSGGATCEIESGTESTPHGVNAGVKRFKPNGTPDEFSALGTHVIDGRRGPGGKTRAECETAPEASSCDETPQNRLIFGTARETQIAIAPPGSAGGTAGNIYVTQSNTQGGKLVDIFGADGKYLGQLTHAGATPFGEPCGVAVDSAGTVFVGDFSGKIHKFVPTANPPVNANHTVTFTSVLQACSLAIGSGPSLTPLFAKRFSTGEIFKLDASSGTSQCQVGTGHLVTIAMDPDSGNLYASKGSEVVEYDTSGACASALSPTTTIPSQVEGIAVDRTSRTGNLYVSRAGSGSIEVYGPLQEPPELELGSPTGVTGARATLTAKVNPRGSTVTECKFEYGKTTSYGSSVPCEGGLPPADSSDHSVTGELSGLLANGTTYHYRFVVRTGANLTVQTDDTTFVTADTFFTNTASDVSDTTATLNGTVRLEGLPLTECQFEYGLSTSYGSTAPCSPDFSSIPSDSLDRTVTAELSGLSKGAIYHFRLKAANSAGAILGEDRNFQTLGPPQVTELGALEVDEDGVKLYGAVNPRGFNTNYYFEYGPTLAYGSRAPADFDLFAGSGTLPVKASIQISGLQSATTYHFRLVASNSSGTIQSPDQVFRTSGASCDNESIRLAQGSAVTDLPDCMALEMVSPPRKNSQQAGRPTVSADGERINFLSLAALSNPPNLLAVGVSRGGEGYVATRSDGGWSTESTAPPSRIVNGWANGEWLARSFTPDLSRWIMLGSSIEGSEYGRGVGQFFSDGLGSAFTPFSPHLAPIDGGIHTRQNIQDAMLDGVSRDHSHLYFTMGELSATYLQGDPTPPIGAERNVYVAKVDPNGEPAELELLVRDSDGKVWGGDCGARIGGMDGSDVSSTGRDQGAVSSDGSRAYLSTRPAQPTNSVPGGPIPDGCNVGSKVRIMERVEQPSGPVISGLVANECSRVSPPCKTEAEVNGHDAYQGASVDQTRVYFTTNRQLADSDLDGSSAECSKTIGVAGCDLYLHDSTKPVGSRLTQVSAGEEVGGLHEIGENARVYNGTVGISGDGSHVYFAAAGVLTEDPNPDGDLAEDGKPNLYVFNADSDALAFIGTLSNGDSGFLWGGSGSFRNRAYPVPVTGSDDSGQEIGGDGHILFFQSRASLIAHDADGDRLDIYRYDADANPAPLQCISCLSGGPDAAPFDVSGADLDFVGRRIGTDFAESGRWVSEDGSTAGFRTEQALVPAATPGDRQGYIWRNGSHFLLPASKGVVPNLIVNGPLLSHDGSTVAFRSAGQLLPQDGDSAGDIYVARVGGGIEEQMQPAPCQGEACQGSPSSPPSGLSSGSTSYAGSGNVVQKPPVKKKKKKNRKRANKKRQGKQAKGHHTSQRASDNQGDRK